MRGIFYVVDDVGAMYARVLARGFTPATPPRDAKWGERYFHLTDPDGHTFSFARPLQGADARLPRLLHVATHGSAIRGPGDHHHFRVAEVVLAEAADEKTHDRGQAPDPERALTGRILELGGTDASGGGR